MIQTFLAAKLSPGPVTNSQIPPMNKPAQINMQHSGTAGALLDAEWNPNFINAANIIFYFFIKITQHKYSVLQIRVELLKSFP